MFVEAFSEVLAKTTQILEAFLGEELQLVIFAF
jgi:hypothetical protein